LLNGLLLSENDLADVTAHLLQAFMDLLHFAGEVGARLASGSG
jgi:hypothetical protein